MGDPPCGHSLELREPPAFRRLLIFIVSSLLPRFRCATWSVPGEKTSQLEAIVQFGKVKFRVAVLNKPLPSLLKEDAVTANVPVIASH